MQRQHSSVAGQCEARVEARDWPRSRYCDGEWQETRRPRRETNTGVEVNDAQVSMPATTNQWHATENLECRLIWRQCRLSATEHEQRRRLWHSATSSVMLAPRSHDHSRRFQSAVTATRTFLSQQPTWWRLRQYHGVVTTATVDMAAITSFNKN